MELTSYRGRQANKQANKNIVDCGKYSREEQSNGGRVQIGWLEKTSLRQCQLSQPCNDLGEEHSRKEWKGKP